MIAKIYSAIPDGYAGQIVEVEGTTARSLPCFNIVGMASKTISEARERVRSAISSSDFTFPAKKVTVNLAPADLNKNGTHLDLSIALTILALSSQLDTDALETKIFIGELSLDGAVKPVRGIINVVETARSAGFAEVFVPVANFAQAKLISGIKVTPVESLRQLVLHLNNISEITSDPPNYTNFIKSKPNITPNSPPTEPTFDQIQGQDLAKRALLIALAGHHNILLSGAPGVGKTFLAHAAASLLPPPSLEEQLSITKIHSLCADIQEIITSRPFRAPHHSSSVPAIIGGGTLATPGEISLAHHGILFLDELPEFPRAVIESLRQPLENKTISVNRVNHSATYPADFMLIATMNPCPCGYLGDSLHVCHCGRPAIERYRSRISGPILDRIDLIVNVERVSSSMLFSDEPPQAPTSPYSHAKCQKMIQDAFFKQKNRQNGRFNASLTSKELQNCLNDSPSAKNFFEGALESLNLSPRVSFKTLRIARTIADLASSSAIKPEHIAEALALRQTLQLSTL